MAGEGHDIAKAANESLQPAYTLIRSQKEKPVGEKQLWGAGEHGSNVTFKWHPNVLQDTLAHQHCLESFPQAD